jgi:biopolymer transport protein ExbD/biopolymer transport protein TolR
MAGMIGGSSLHRRRTPVLNADINVTSLVDVAFVLLIIFMVTAPIMQGGIDVELPKAKVAPLSSKDGVVVSVDRRGRIYVDDIAVTPEEFRATIRRLVDQRNVSSVYVRGDRTTPYGNVVRVVAALHAAGITGAGLVAEEEDIDR